MNSANFLAELKRRNVYQVEITLKDPHNLTGGSGDN